MKWPHAIYVVNNQSELYSLPYEVGCVAICKDTDTQWLYGKTLGWMKISEPEDKKETSIKGKTNFHHNCPNCGAPINPHKEKCEYCDTYYFNEPTKSQEKENLDELMHKWESFPPIPTAEPLTTWR